MLTMRHTFGQLQRTLESFLDKHLGGLENEERIEALHWYCQGLGLELPQKTIFGIGARLDPDNVEHRRQRIQRAVQKGRFSHEDVFERIRSTLFTMSADKVDAYAIDDTGVAKKGEHSVGVQRQYSGTLGKVDNCQVVVTLHGVSDVDGLCIGAELYLPEQWIDDDARLDEAKVPDDRRRFHTKPEIALALLRSAKGQGAPNRPVVADAAYGDSRNFRDGIAALGVHYAVAISSNTTVWPPGCNPGAPKSSGKPGRPAFYDRDPKGRQPRRVDKLASQYWKPGKFRTVIWRQGSKGPLRGEFYGVRIHSAERRTKGRTAGDPIWLLIERDGPCVSRPPPREFFPRRRKQIRGHGQTFTVPYLWCSCTGSEGAQPASETLRTASTGG